MPVADPLASWTAEPSGRTGPRRASSPFVSLCVGATGTTVAIAAVCWAEARVARRRPRPCGIPPGSDGRHGQGEDPPLRVLWLGDSLAVGVGVDEAHEVPAAQLAHHLGRPCDVQVRAVPGATAADVLEHQLTSSDLDDADVVVVQVGANDVAGMTNRRGFRATYREILATVAGLDGVTVVCVGIPDFSAAERLPEPLRSVAGMRGRMLDAVIRDEARAAGCAFVDISSRPADLDRSATRALLSADRYHPGPAGYAIWAARIATTVRVLAVA